jgi:hypothetical protein
MPFRKINKEKHCLRKLPFFCKSNKQTQQKLVRMIKEICFWLAVAGMTMICFSVFLVLLFGVGEQRAFEFYLALIGMLIAVVFGFFALVLSA